MRQEEKKTALSKSRSLPRETLSNLNKTSNVNVNTVLMRVQVKNGKRATRNWRKGHTPSKAAKGLAEQSLRLNHFGRQNLKTLAMGMWHDFKSEMFFKRQLNLKIY